MLAYTMPQQKKEEESKRLRVERDQIKFIDLEKYNMEEYERQQGKRYTIPEGTDKIDQ